MTQIEILEKLKKLTAAERLAFVETALRLIREDIEGLEGQPTARERREQLAKAAQALLPDYKAGGELTAFTALDGEDFCAKG